MDYSSSIAIIALSVTTVTTLGLFFVQTMRQERHAQRAVRGQLVAEMIGTMERSARPFSRPALLRPWTRPEFEFVLAVPRLMLNLERADAAVGHWALTQTQLMRVAATDRAAMQIGVMLTVRLTEWHQGELDRSWFTQELQKSPLNSDVKVPAASALRRSFSRSREYFVEVLALGLMIAPSAAALAWTFYTPTRSGRRH